MTPKSFDVATAKDWVGDTRMRVIETKARADADKDRYEPPNKLGATFSSYAAGVAAQMDDNVYFNAFKKRKERIQRLAA